MTSWDRARAEAHRADIAMEAYRLRCEEEEALAQQDDEPPEPLIEAIIVAQNEEAYERLYQMTRQRLNHETPNSQ